MYLIIEFDNLNSKRSSNSFSYLRLYDESSNEAHTVDALAVRGDEGRDSLR